ncbi:MAG: hypothetical protein GY699_23225 [Desulfobacteraceae bacterium]|nr:hypothetical protein [Desulfobacteraceae bacterium]
MTDEEKPKGWLKTVPGILSAIAAVLTAITGLLVALNQVGVFNGKEKPLSQVTQPSHGETAPSTIEHPSAASQSEMRIAQKKSEPIVLRRSAYRNPIKTGARLYYFDFDTPKQLLNATSNVDFFFKPNSNERNTKIGIVPHNGAKFAPRSLDLFPWEVDEGDLTSARGVYSVPQGKKIPCITSSGTYCTFYLKIEDNAEFLVAFVLYELR